MYELLYLQLDLSSLASIREFVEEFIHKKKKISVLVNNAAICLSPSDLTRNTTTDGYEVTLATNYIGMFDMCRLEQFREHFDNIFKIDDFLKFKS